jgi:RNA polymerase sigma-70 factor (ECF subfamily)
MREESDIEVEAYYRRYAPLVFRRCVRMLKSEDTAHDAVHDVFVQLVVHQGRLRGEAPSGLLLRMATNVCLNRIRSRRRRPEDGHPDLLARIAWTVDEEQPSLARSTLRSLFSRQPESSRTIAVMHFLDGLTLEEVAAEVGMSVSGVRKRLRRLREQLALEEGKESAEERSHA